MTIKVKPGKYIVAVSGGVDSMALLDLMAIQPGLEIIVAHFDHGIRKESFRDAKLVKQAAAHYGLKFELGYGRLGAGANEEAARAARYNFLFSLQKKHRADSVITAHHQDDVLETAALNILRGTGPAGMVAILSNKQVLRPLLGFSKHEILDHAKSRELAWREDKTNLDVRFLRNRVRHNLVAKMSANERQQMLTQINQINDAQTELAQLLAGISARLTIGGRSIDRAAFASLPVEVAETWLISWLRQNGVNDIDRKLIRRLSTAIKTGRPGTSQNVKRGCGLKLSRTTASLESPLSTGVI